MQPRTRSGRTTLGWHDAGMAHPPTPPEPSAKYARHGRVVLATTARCGFALALGILGGLSPNFFLFLHGHWLSFTALEPIQLTLICLLYTIATTDRFATNATMAVLSAVGAVVGISMIDHCPSFLECVYNNINTMFILVIFIVFLFPAAAVATRVRELRASRARRSR